MKTKKLSFITLLVAAAILFTAEIPYAARTELRVAVHLDMTRLDPVKCRLGTDHLIIKNTMSGLLKFKLGTTSVEKDLAESYEVSKDGKIITFKLRKGVKFHKGYGEVTSADVKFSLMRHLDPKVGSLLFEKYSIVDHVEAPGKYTVKIFLKKPSAGFFSILAFHLNAILSKKAVEELGDKINSMPIGTGPFQFESRIPGQEIVLTANEDYFLAPPKIKRLILKVVQEPSVAINAVQKGDIDYYSIEDIGALRSVHKIKDKNFKLSSCPSINVYYLYLNCVKGPTRHLKVRQAIAHAIDKKAICKSFAGMVDFIPSIFPSVFPNYTDDLPTYEYNVERARELLREAGYDKNTKVTVSYVKYGIHEDVAVMAKHFISKIMDPKLLMLDIAQYWNFLKEGKYEVYSQGLAKEAEDIYASTFFHSKGARNFHGCKSAELDRFIEQADMEMDPVKRKALYKKVQEIMAINLPYLVIGVHKCTDIMNKNLYGIEAQVNPAMNKFYGAYFRE